MNNSIASSTSSRAALKTKMMGVMAKRRKNSLTNSMSSLDSSHNDSRQEVPQIKLKAPIKQKVVNYNEKPKKKEVILSESFMQKQDCNNISLIIPAGNKDQTIGEVSIMGLQADLRHKFSPQKASMNKWQ